MYKMFGLNPDWVETGNGPAFLKGSGSTDMEFKSIPKVRARLCAGGGSFEVGRASTKAVVYSSIVILLFNVILTQLLLS